MMSTVITIVKHLKVVKTDQLFHFECVQNLGTNPSFVGFQIQISGQYLIHFVWTKAPNSVTDSLWDFN